MSDDDSTAILHAFLRAVSFPAGGHPDYPQIAELFRPEAQLVRCSGPEPESLGVSAFIHERQQAFDRGDLTWFHEEEREGQTEFFGRVAQRRSVYTKAGSRAGVPFATTGVIFTHFTRGDRTGWRIASMIWDDEPTHS